MESVQAHLPSTCGVIGISGGINPRFPVSHVVQIVGWVVEVPEIVVGAPRVVGAEQPVDPDTSLRGNTV